MTFAEYMTRWLTEYVQDRVSGRTAQRYEGIVQNHLVPALGETMLRALDPAGGRRLFFQSCRPSSEPNRSVYRVDAAVVEGFRGDSVTN